MTKQELEYELKCYYTLAGNAPTRKLLNDILEKIASIQEKLNRR